MHALVGDLDELRLYRAMTPYDGIVRAHTTSNVPDAPVQGLLNGRPVALYTDTTSFGFGHWHFTDRAGGWVDPREIKGVHYINDN